MRFLATACALAIFLFGCDGQDPVRVRKVKSRVDPVELITAATVFIEAAYRPIDVLEPAPDELFPSSGSGFVIDPQGLIVTNAHVVASVVQVDVRTVTEATEKTRPEDRRVFVLHRVTARLLSGTPESEEFSAQVLCTRTSPKGGDRTLVSDLALLRIRAGRPLTALTLANDREIEVLRETTSVIVAGFPGGRARARWFDRITRRDENPNGPPISFRTGAVTSLMRDERNDVIAIEHSCNTQPGSSGGPLVDEDGRVLGVHFSGSPFGEQTKYAITTPELRSVLPYTFWRMRQAARRTPPYRTVRVALGESVEKAVASARPGDTVDVAPGRFEIGEAPLLVPEGVWLRGAGMDGTTLVGGLLLDVKTRTAEVSGLTIEGKGVAALTIRGDSLEHQETFVHDVRLIQGGGEPALLLDGSGQPDLVRLEARQTASHPVVRIEGEDTDRPRPRIERLNLLPMTDTQAGSGSGWKGALVVLEDCEPTFLGCSLPPQVTFLATTPAVQFRHGFGDFVGCLFAFPENAQVGGLAIDTREGGGEFTACHFEMPCDDQVAIRVVHPSGVQLEDCRLISSCFRAIRVTREPTRYGDFESVVEPRAAIILEGFRGVPTLARRCHFVECCFGVGVLEDSGRIHVDGIGRSLRIDQMSIRADEGNRYTELPR